MFLRHKLAMMTLALTLLTVPTLAENENSSIHFPIQEDQQNDIEVAIPEGWEIWKGNDKNALEILSSFFDTKIYGIRLQNASQDNKSYIFFMPHDEDSSNLSAEELMECNEQLQDQMFPGSETQLCTVDTLRKIVWATFHANDGDAPPLSGGIALYSIQNYDFVVMTGGLDEGQKNLTDTLNTFIQSVNIVPKTQPVVDAEEQVPVEIVEAAPQETVVNIEEQAPVDVIVEDAPQETQSVLVADIDEAPCEETAQPVSDTEESAVVESDIVVEAAPQGMEEQLPVDIAAAPQEAESAMLDI